MQCRSRLSQLIPKTALLSSLIICLAAPQVVAVEKTSGWYLGAGWGNYQEKSDFLVDPSKSNSGFNIFAGYALLSGIAFEVGFLDLDNLEDRRDLAGFPFERDRYEFSGHFARLLLGFPIYKSPETIVTLFGSGGAHRWDIDIERRDRTTGTITPLADGSDTSAAVGAGLWIRTKRASTRIEYTSFREFDGNAVDEDFELGLWTINFIYHF